jgi:hypothetical protein
VRCACQTYTNNTTTQQRNTTTHNPQQLVDLKACDVYSYKSDGETDPFGEEASVWAFNYFFYNKRLKRILYLSCRAAPKSAADGVRAIRCCLSGGAFLRLCLSAQYLFPDTH